MSRFAKNNINLIYIFYIRLHFRIFLFGIFPVFGFVFCADDYEPEFRCKDFKQVNHDPYLSNQWHLSNNGKNFKVSGADAKVKQSW